jgi:hypothetical protein
MALESKTPLAGSAAGLRNSSCVAADNPEITQLSTETQRQFSPTDAVKAALIRDLLSECLSRDPRRVQGDPINALG